MSSLGAPLLILIFAACAGVIWVAGIWLSSSTEAIDNRFRLGAAVGGLLLLALATNLPELAITIFAAIKDNLDLAVGNLLGGIAIQTVVLAALDAGAGPERPLTYLVGSLLVVVEAALVGAVAVAAVMTSQLPESTNVAGASPGTVAIVIVFVAGLWLLVKTRNRQAWRLEAPGAQPGRSHRQRRAAKPRRHREHSTRVVIAIFAAAALATLVAGYFIEESGNELAGRAGLTGAVFGATILAAATALPELSTGLAAVRLGDHQLAMSDIFGGNAVLPALVIFADLIGGKPALPLAHTTDVWIACLGVLLTAVYIAGMVLRPTKTFLRMGYDSIAVIVLYAIGIVGLAAVR